MNFRLGFAAFVAGAVGCSGDPPGDGSLLLYIENLSADGPFTAVDFEIVKVGLYLNRTPADGSSNCSFAGAIDVAVPPSSTHVNLTRTGLNLVGGFLVAPSEVQEIRVLVRDLVVARGGVAESARTRVGCHEVHDNRGHLRYDDDDPNRGVGQKLGLLRLRPTLGATVRIISDQTTKAAVLFEPRRDIIAPGTSGNLHMASSYEMRVLATGDLQMVPIDRVVAKFSSAVSEARIATLIASRRMSIVARWRLNNYYVLSLPADTSLEAALRDLQSLPEVEVTLPDVVMEGGITNPNDPGWANQSQFSQVNLPKAWDIGTGSSQSIVAIVDTGVDLTHPDLIDNIFINVGEIPPRVLSLITDSNGDGAITWRDIDFNGDNDGVLEFSDLDSATNVRLGVCPRSNSSPTNRCDPLDLVDGTGDATFGWQDGVDNDNADGLGTFVDDLVGWNFQLDNNWPVKSGGARSSGAHGTQLAGIAGAVGNNATDLAGASWHLRILPVRIDTGNTGGLFQPYRSSAILGINYAALVGADVINLSSGFFGLTGTQPSFGCGTNAVVAGLPADRFEAFHTKLENEMSSSVNLRSSVLVPIAHNCAVNIDGEGVFEWPSSFKNNQFLVVGSVAPSGNLSTFSASGASTVDLGAPGEGYQVLQPPSPPGAPETNTNICTSSVGDCSGTSFSAALVSGTVALVLSQNLSALRGHPCLLVDQVLRNAGTMGEPKGSVAGDRLLDADRAIRNAVTTPVRACP